ncbi:CAP domain-containing protein [Streptomyces sp. NPDC006678]|uniref:CAP domain-containing protein n=1 Tax=Streptomyces sp. NPDC006678 TaxID=3157185 RepID=UPI0033E98469
MRKHRRKTHYRKITIAAVALSAVAVPSVAMACMDPQETPGSQETQGSQQSRGGKSWGDWQNASADKQGQQGQHGERWQHGGWDWKKKSGGEQGGSEETGAQPTAPSAPAAPSAPTTSAPQAPKAPASPSAPKPAASPSKPAAAAPASGAVARVVQLVNSERSKAGCSPVTVNAKLTKAAQDHSKDMAAHRNMSHDGSDGSNPGDRITRAGYSWSTYGENVAYGYDTPEQVMAGWMSSPGHKRNILNCEFKEIGVALAQPDNYWTQDFGTAR